MSADEDTAGSDVAPFGVLDHPSRRRLGLWIPVVLLFGLGVVACGAFVSRSAGHECTLVGCSGLFNFDLASQPQPVRDAAVTGTICIGDRCSTQPIAAGQQRIFVELTRSVVPDASVVLTNASGTELVRFESEGSLEAEPFYPNGKDCGAPCWSVLVVGRDGVLEPST